MTTALPCLRQHHVQRQNCIAHRVVRTNTEGVRQSRSAPNKECTLRSAARLPAVLPPLAASARRRSGRQNLRLQRCYRDDYEGVLVGSKEGSMNRSIALAALALALVTGMAALVTISGTASQHSHASRPAGIALPRRTRNIRASKSFTMILRRLITTCVWGSIGLTTY
jgi:hypothetical protein